MDASGGKITWFLTANDTDFQLTMQRVRKESKKTGDDVDRDMKRGLGGAKLSLDDFRRSLGRSASTFRDFQIALRGFELTSLIIGASVASGAIIELVGALSALGGLLYTLPAGISTFAGAFAALKVATGGIGDAFKAATKATTGMSAASTLAKRQADVMKASMKQDAALTKRLTDLKEQYADTVKELAQERLRLLNETIMKGVTAWSNITSAARSFLDVARDIRGLSQDVATAQMNLNSAILTYGASSVQARDATQALYEAQARLADANAELDYSYTSIKDNVRDLATNLNSLTKANKNEMKASLLNLKAMRLEKQSRGENVSEIEDIITVLDELINIKDTKLTVNPDLVGAQNALDGLKSQFPDIAVAAQVAASSTEESLVKSLGKISDSMADVRTEREELQKDLIDKMKELNEQSAASAGADPFAGLSKNAKSFVLALIDVKNAFEPVKMAIQDKFFAGLDTEIRNIAKTSFPMLERGLGAIATAFNGMAKEGSRVIQQPFFQGAVESSLMNTAKATDILTKAIEPIARAFTDLVNIGNPYVLMLSDWIVKQSELAAAFTGSAEGQERIKKAIDNGIDALKVLGKFLGSVMGLFSDLFKVSQASGFSLINTFTEMIDKIRDWLATEDGQNKMKALFEATDTILRAVLETLGGFIKGLLTVVEAYNNLDGPLKDFITNLLVFSAVATPIITYLSSMWASLKLVGLFGREAFQLAGAGIPAFKKGLEIAKQGIFDLQSGFSDARAAGSTFTGFMGTIGGKLRELKDGAVLVAGSIKDMALTSAATAKQMVLDAAKMAKQGAVAAGGWIKGAAQTSAAWIASFAGMVARGVVTVATFVAQGIAAAASWIAGAVATAAAWVVANIAILGVWGLIIAAVVGAVALIVANWDSIVNFFKGVWDAIVGFIAGAIDWVKNNWPLLLAILLGPIAVAALLIAQNWETVKQAFANAWQFIKNIWGGVVGFFQGVWNGIVNIFKGVGSWFSNVFQQAWNGIKNIWGAVGGFFSGIWNNIANAFNGVYNLGRNIVEGLWNGISNMVGWIGNKIRGFGDSVLSGIKNFFGIRSPSRVMRDEVGKMLGLGIAGGIIDSTADAVKAAKSAATAITDGFAMGVLGTEFGVSADSIISAQFAPSMVNTADDSNGFTNGVVINQTNEVHTDLDMDQVNRNLTWELNKL